MVYAKKLKLDYLPKLYYLIFWKRYLKKENILTPILAVQYLRKLISLFHKDYFDKLIATSKAINIALSMAMPTIKPVAKIATKF